MSVTDSGSLRDDFANEPPARFWRSLDDLSRTPSFRVKLGREFPDIAARFGRAVGTDRRTALKLLGASLLMAGVAACKAPAGIAPYVDQPENIIPGRPRFFATAMPLDGYAMGVIAESHEGRPTKIEGNPLHPGSLGGTDPIMQASVWSLYDPARSRNVRRGTEISTWDEFLQNLAAVRAAYLPKGGGGLGILIGAETSPTLKRQLAALKAALPGLKVYRHAPLNPPAAAPVPVYDLGKARTILALDGDFLGQGPGKLAYARAFAEGRRVRKASRQMSRLYVIETVPTLTGANADWVRRLKPSAIDGVVQKLLEAMSGSDVSDPDLAPLLADLKAGNAIVVTGPQASPYVQAVAAQLNQRLGAPVRMIAPFEIAGDGDLKALVGDIGAGRIETLLVSGVDPVHAAPAGLDVVSALKRLKALLHHGLHLDATAKLAHWHAPATHYLEAWSDGLAYDGSAGLIQPLIAPLYDSHTLHEIVAALGGDYTAGAHDLVRATWTLLDDAGWTAALKAGRIENTAAARVAPPAPALPAPATQSGGIEVKLRPDPYFRDGTYAPNLPLNELARPLTKLVWGNAAEMAPKTAAALGLKDADEVELVAGGTHLVLPTFIHPGTPEDTIVVALGWGRAYGDGDPVGANAYPLLGQAGPLIVGKTGQRGRLVTVQNDYSMEGRDLIHEVALTEWPGPPPIPEEQPRVMPQWDNPDEAWGMSIDLTSCIGCMACVSACVAENNSPVVGIDEVDRGHDMHWLRVDRYYSGDVNAPETSFQPVPCMQCEDAPCEVVCPVNATVHTHDGLNAQVYNRCVGTRYCSQNCPYKVRRFNFFDYNKDISETSPLSLLMNPDVTVRERGVMEKCTYCVQRIAEARIGGDVADKPIADGTIQTACQQACPTRAITFGNINDKTAKVVAEKAEPTNYAMLAELGTRPRTTYLSKVRNHPEGGSD
jgi:molybdopterin-containing oxidoreductase family iron-sulfur binding subunit